MKTSITFIVILFLSTRIYSQVTITGAFNPVSGDFQMEIFCDTTNISEGSPGANMVWNFPTLTRQDSTLTNWVNPATTPYASSFPTANIASTNNNSKFDYLTTSSSALIYNGTGSPTHMELLSDPETYIQYPFAYNSSFIDNYYSSYISNVITHNRNGAINVTGDAWGTINLPFGSFSGSLRVKLIINERDSATSGPPYVLISHVTEYWWFVPGKKFPVFEITNGVYTLNGNQTISNKVVSYNSTSHSVGITIIGNVIPDKFSLSQNYPNPFNPVTDIKFEIPKSSFVKIIVFDITGREAQVLVNQQLQPGSYNTIFDGGFLSSGIYFYKLTAGEFTETKKLMLIK